MKSFLTIMVLVSTKISKTIHADVNQKIAVDILLERALVGELKKKLSKK